MISRQSADPTIKRLEQIFVSLNYGKTGEVVHEIVM
jgi:hypothetical protein